jgi:hypothetical protein
MNHRHTIQVQVYNAMKSIWRTYLLFVLPVWKEFIETQEYMEKLDNGEAKY